MRAVVGIVAVGLLPAVVVPVAHAINVLYLGVDGDVVGRVAWAASIALVAVGGYAVGATQPRRA